MSVFSIYYLETNLICMFFMGLVLILYMRHSRGLTEAKWFISSIIGVELYCLSDICAALFKYQEFSGVRSVLWIANVVYITIPLVLAAIWQRYVYEHMRRFYDINSKTVLVNRITIGVTAFISLLSLSSPITHFSFYLDEMNLYHRSIGAYAVPAIAYAILIAEFIKAQIFIKNCNSLEARTEARVLSFLPIPCIFFSLMQVFYYGITTAQVGFTMGYMIVFLSRQQNAVSRDELTGLNNRRQFDFVVDRLSRSSGTAFVAMIDVDDFKKINDTLGHSEGDEMLRAVADVLYRVCNNPESLGKFRAYRYGGDEFVIVSDYFKGDDVAVRISTIIDKEVSAWNGSKTGLMKMSLSCGIASGNLEKENIRQLVKRADNEMYKMKKAKNTGR